MRQNPNIAKIFQNPKDTRWITAAKDSLQNEIRKILILTDLFYANSGIVIHLDDEPIKKNFFAVDISVTNL